jgi:CheY-like chemotaxis protein/putative methionine-R-sulfoxide reductase with GAF domain
MISVLYVDDEPDLLEIGAFFLESQGLMRVDCIGSAQEALEMIGTTPYDAIVSDFQMPGMDGIAFLKILRRNFPDLPFIIFTGKSREEIVIEALNSGADYYIQKGGEPQSQFAELAHSIRRSVERKRANETIIHLNRLYSVVSSTNRAIVHIRDRQSLLHEACRIAVEEGGFLMSWIGMVDMATREVTPIAACGYEEGYLSNLSVSIDNIPQGMGLTGTAIRENRSIISNDIVSDRLMAHYRDEAAKRGYRSSAAVPVRSGDRTVGAMRFYSGESNFFSNKEIHLLEELVADISFALEIVDRT